MHFLHPIAALTAFTTLTMAQEAPVAPKMTLLYSMEALLGERFSLGPIPTGDERIVIPIVGGTFKGPKMNGMQCTSPHFKRLTSCSQLRLTTPQEPFSTSAQIGA
jgi:hypothetical protein